MMRINDALRGTADKFYPLQYLAWILFIQFFTLQIDFIYHP